MSITGVASRQIGAVCYCKVLVLYCTQAFKEGDVTTLGGTSKFDLNQLLLPMQAFKEGDVRFLICTDVAARGIDIQVGAHLRKLSSTAARFRACSYLVHKLLPQALSMALHLNCLLCVLSTGPALRDQHDAARPLRGLHPPVSLTGQ